MCAGFFFFFFLQTSRVSGGLRTSINDENSRSLSPEDERPAARFDVPTSKSSFRRAVPFYSPLTIGRGPEVEYECQPPCLKKKERERERERGNQVVHREVPLWESSSWRGSQSRGGGKKNIFSAIQTTSTVDTIRKHGESKSLSRYMYHGGLVARGEMITTRSFYSCLHAMIPGDPLRRHQRVQWPVSCNVP